MPSMSGAGVADELPPISSVGVATPGVAPGIDMSALLVNLLTQQAEKERLDRAERERDREERR